MQIKNDEHARVGSHATDGLQVGETALGEMLAVVVDNAFVQPVAYRNTQRVEAVGGHAVDVVLCQPGLPVVLENRVSLVLSERADAVKLGCLVAAAHRVPGAGCHPWLKNKVGSRADAADGALGVE